VPSLLVPTLLGVLMLDPAALGDRPAGLPFATRSPVVARHGMVATSQPLAARIGLRVLEDGGSAVDAAIATNAALGVMEPTGAGIGGDLFAIVWDEARDELVGINGSGRAPRGLDLEGLRARLEARGADRIPLFDGLAVSVPGCVDAWFALHERYGRLPMERLLAPAIEAAREGFPVSQVIAHHWTSALTRYPGEAFASFHRTFLLDGEPPREGQLFANPALADTYERLAAGGRDAFYEGPVARAIVDAVAAHGGALALEDLSAHESEWVTPISVAYRGHRVWELPPNGQGLAALQMLAILEGFDPSAMGFGSAPLLHHLIETKKLVYEDRAASYADPAFADVPVAELLSPDYAAARRALVDPERAATDVRAGEPALARGDTVYLTVADDDGNVVSWIQSNYTGFGSGIVPEGTGVCLQNRGALFHLDPDHPNAYAPGKRPFHTIIPAMMTRDGRPVLSFGVMGGAQQPMGHVQIVTNVVDFGMNVQEAGDAPRWSHAGSSGPTGAEAPAGGGGVVHLESGHAPEVVEALRALGHDVRPGGYFGGYQGIRIEHGGDPDARMYSGGSESRKDGLAVGY